MKKRVNKSSKKIPLIIISLILILFVGGILFIFRENIFDSRENQMMTKGVLVVPTLKDEITKDSSWCATFEIVWNDMKNEIVKKDIVMNPQLEMVDNLNKEEFTEYMLSEDYYYKKYGLKTLALKEEIEKGIKEKFNEKSDILDKFDWQSDALDNSNENRYFFYTMLYREFNFLKEFTKLDNDNFGKYSDIKYFGINNKTDSTVGEQIKVLFYNSEDDFAILINTKNNDEVIIYKNPLGKNFQEVYDNLIKKEKEYEGDISFKEQDQLKIPYLNFNILREYSELENKEFSTYNGKAKIEKAIQSIKFELNERGGKIKSESGLDTENYESAPSIGLSRYFYVDDTFAIFLKEKEKDIPYFAASIDDITKFQ